MSSAIWPTEDAASRRLVASGDFAEDAYYSAQNPGLRGEDGLHFVVLGLQADVVLFAIEPLHGRLLADQSDDDFAVDRVVAGPHDHVVGLEDAGVLHAFAADLEDVVAVLAADHVGDLEVLLDVLFGQDRLARCDLSDQR